ncbi:hypothetical protein [Pseudophaeobacter sp.]|uniref:hypothetical protein n=1 Tax=Pseudophaeobacter sp. TaxID=1971739 RepID=UPI0032981394
MTIAVAARAALRGVPLILAIRTNFIQSPRTELHSIRSLLSLALLATRELSAVDQATIQNLTRKLAYPTTLKDFSNATRNPQLTAVSSATAVSFDGYPGSASDTISTSASDKIGGQWALSAALSDPEPGRDLDSQDVLEKPLWPANMASTSILGAWESFRHTRESSTTWAFWIAWYQGFLDGKPLDWELQRRVALIDDAIWDAGPEAVAKEIEHIQARYGLEQELAALKEQLTAQQQIIARDPQIGDNGGPPMDGPNAKGFKKDLVLVWSDIEELDAELAKPEPSTPVLKRLAQSLSEAALRIAAYCGTTVDVSVKAAAKTFGATLGPIGATEIVKPGSIEAVAKAIGKFLTALAN